MSTQRTREKLGGTREKLGYHDQHRFLLDSRYPKESLEHIKKHDIQHARLEGPDMEEARRVYQLGL